MIRICK